MNLVEVLSKLFHPQPCGAPEQVRRASHELANAASRLQYSAQKAREEADVMRALVMRMQGEKPS